MDGWMGGKAGLRIAYSNQKQSITTMIWKSSVTEGAYFCFLVIWVNMVVLSFSKQDLMDTVVVLMFMDVIVFEMIMANLFQICCTQWTLI